MFVPRVLWVNALIQNFMFLGSIINVELPQARIEHMNQISQIFYLQSKHIDILCLITDFEWKKQKISRFS